MFTIIGLAILSLITGFAYADNKVRLYKRVWTKSTEFKEFDEEDGQRPKEYPTRKDFDKLAGIRPWDRALCWLYWPTKLGDVHNHSYSMMYDTAIKQNQNVTTGYYLLHVFFWPAIFVFLSSANIVLQPFRVLKFVFWSLPDKLLEMRRKKEETMIEQRIAELESVKLDKMLPAERLYHELLDKEKVIKDYVDVLNSGDDVYNKLIGELDAKLGKLVQVISKFRKFKETPKEENKTEKAIYDLAISNHNALDSYKKQITAKKTTLSDFLNVILVKLSEEKEQVSAVKNQEQENAEALAILNSLGQEVHEIDLRANNYFDSRVLEIMNVLGTLMDDAMNQNLIKESLAQIQAGSQVSGLQQLDLANDDKYQDWQIRTLTFLDEVDNKIKYISDKLDLPEAKVFQLSDKKIA